MKIISVRKGFASDHSSTSYEFLAVDRPLDKKARAAVASLSRRAHPTKRRASFVYHADGYDLPGGWKPLMKDHYDVMYSESYDWWFLVLAFPLPPQQQKEIEKYSFIGLEDMGVNISFYGERTIVAIFCRLTPFGLFDDECWELFEEEDEDNSDGKGAFEDDLLAELGDPLLYLLARIRKQLMEGDYRALYEVWKKYRDSEKEGDWKEEPEPPFPQERKTGEKIIAMFAARLDTI